MSSRRCRTPAWSHPTAPRRPRPRSRRRSIRRPSASRSSRGRSTAAARPAPRAGSRMAFSLAKAFAWSKRKTQKLSHRNALARLKSLGFAPGVIYDIGAYRGGWTRLAAEVFPAAQFVLFEANADHAGELASSGHRHVIAALGAQDGVARPFHVPQRGDATGASLYIEKTANYAEPNLQVRQLATARLDTLVARDRLSPPPPVKKRLPGGPLR